MDITPLSHIKDWDRKSCPKCGSLFKATMSANYTAQYAENAQELFILVGPDKFTLMNALTEIKYPQLVPLDDLGIDLVVQCIGCQQLFTEKDMLAYYDSEEE